MLQDKTPSNKLELDSSLPVDQMIISFLQQIEPIRKSFASDKTVNKPEKVWPNDISGPGYLEAKHTNNIPDFTLPQPANRQDNIGFQIQNPNNEYNFYPPYYGRPGPSSSPSRRPLISTGNNLNLSPSELMFQPMYDPQLVAALKSGFLSEPINYNLRQTPYPKMGQSFDYGYGRDYFNGYPENNFDLMRNSNPDAENRDYNRFLALKHYLR